MDAFFYKERIIKMADQNITELPVKTSSGITSSDYMLGIDSAEGYQMLIRDLGDYIIRNVQVNTIAGSNQTLKNALDTLNSNKLGQIPRCKDITSYFTDGTLWNRISGTGYPHAYYDIQPGDYIDMGRTITCPNIQQDTYGTVGSRYVTVVSLGGLQGNGDSSAVTYNHLVMVPGQGLGGSQHFGRHRMNPTNTTEGGYVGSQMFTDILGAVVSAGSVATGATINQQLYYVFGSHLKTTRELLSNAVGTSLYNRFGSATGASSGGAWTSVQACLMSEVEVYGSVVWSSSAYDTGSACKQFELFAQSKAAINNRSAYYWLKDVASSSTFAAVYNYGYAYYRGASGADHFVRPRFIIA